MLYATLTPSVARAGALVALLGGVTACAPASSTPQASLQTSQSPVLLSCPSGQQPLLRQVVVNGAAVPQVECVAAAAVASTAHGQAPQAPVAAAQYQPTYAPVPQAYAPAPTYAPAPAYVPVAAAPAPVRTVSSRPAARRVVYDDDVVEYREKKRRSWQKSALIIGSSAGVGAGIGAATGGKKGALIGAAVGGGAATVWDQVTRR
jgi:hypothetical protein